MTVEEKALKQTIVIDVMPLVGGHLPLPAIRLSKYSFSFSLLFQTPPDTTFSSQVHSSRHKTGPGWRQA